ncbi:transposase [Streptomyces virginiae]|uniref:transposase n=1 Tax=Streptomyces virginiae TaxID=1961 RepID=UPI0033265526
MDDTGFPRDGKASTAVVRPASNRGPFGKVGNCQIRGECSLRFRHRFVPAAWDSPGAAGRRQGCRIPGEHHQPKWRLALNMPEVLRCYLVCDSR